MELFAKLFSSLLAMVYHCFDRMVIHGCLSGLSRPEQVVCFFRDLAGVPAVDIHDKSRSREKSILLTRAMEQRVRTALQNPQLAIMPLGESSCLTQNQTSICCLGPVWPSQKIEYCRNFIFKRHFPIRRIFERSSEMGLWRLTANKISEILGSRITKKLKGKLHTTLQQIEHGQHIFRAYWKHAFLKRHEKFSTFLRNEIRSNNLTDFGLKKGLEHLAAVREKFLAIADRFAAFQAQCLNVHVGFPLLQRLALPIPVATAKYPGIKIHDTRMIRLMEVLRQGDTRLGGWRAKQVHEAILTSCGLSALHYGLNQLRYDLAK